MRTTPVPRRVVHRRGAVLRLWFFVRLYRVVMRSGANMDVMAKAVVDDPTVSDAISFYQDGTRHQLIAKVMRSEVAGLILYPRNPERPRSW